LSKRVIPRVPVTADRDRRGFDEAVKERFEVLSGLRGGKIKPLSSEATTTDIINKINEVLALIQ
jgi:hypothetical protein